MSPTNRCDSCDSHLPYALLVSEDGKKWRVHHERIIGRAAANDAVNKMKAEQPALYWRVYPRNVADALLFGIKLGRSLEHDRMRHRRNHVRPSVLLALPENI